MGVLSVDLSLLDVYNERTNINHKFFNMTVRTILIWAMINQEDWPPTANEKELDKMGWIKCLFPGINFYSITGAFHVQNSYFVPVLKKLYPTLIGVKGETIDPNETIELEEFLACNGYEHYDNPEWKKRFDALLAS